MKLIDIVIIAGIVGGGLVLVYGLISGIPAVMRPIAAALGGGL